jgi:hypothetical protein
MTGFAPGNVMGQDTLATCAQIEDDNRRLVCYDRLTGRGPKGTSTPVPVAATAAAVTLPSTDPAADFGLSQQVIKERDPDQWVESIAAAVSNVGKGASGRYVVSLDNDQVWEQIETDSYPVLKPGDAVTIRRAAVGSFILAGPRSISWRVRRTR